MLLAAENVRPLNEWFAADQNFAAKFWRPCRSGGPLFSRPIVVDEVLIF
jgi:hypothetical protein